MKMNRLLFVFIFLFSEFDLQAQNLIYNGGFENYSNCPGSGGFSISLATPWQSASLSHPPYINACASLGSCCGIPVHFTIGYQMPRTGDGMSLFATYSQGHINTREYLRCALKDTLTANQTYCLTFYVNLANPSFEAIDAIGAYFSDTAISCGTLFCLLNFQPQVSNPAGNILADTLGWMQISGCFTALGNERYIYIGNFNTDAQTLTAPNFGTAATSYYIDDISLQADIGANINKYNKEHLLTISPNPTENILSIQSNQAISEIELIDLTGKTIKSISSSKSMDVSDVLNGIYVVKCKLQNGEVAFLKISVMHR